MGILKYSAQNNLKTLGAKIIKYFCICSLVLLILLIMGENLFYNQDLKNRINEGRYVSVFIVNERLYGSDTGEFYVASDELAKEISNVLKKATYKRKLIQNSPLYNHRKDVVSIKIQYYDKKEHELLSMTFYSDGVSIIDGEYVEVNIYDDICGLLENKSL